MEKTLEQMTIADVMATDAFDKRLQARVEQFRKVADLKPVCREVLNMNIDELKKNHQECVAGTCKQFSLVQRQFVRMLIESSLRAEIKALKRNQDTTTKTSEK